MIDTIKEVKLMRVEDNNSHLPVEVQNERTVKLGSMFVNRAPLTGLKKEEERKYLPKLIGTDPTDPNFGEKAMEFWRTLTVKVPVEGVTLNITTDDEGEPLNVSDYLIYRFAKAHKLVAEDRDAAQGNITKRFYFYSPEKEIKKENDNVQWKLKAYTEFVQVKDDEDKVDMLLRLLTDSRPEHLNLPQKQNILSEEIENNPKKFYKATQDKNAELKSLIHDMVSYGVIEKIGDQYAFFDEVLGNNMRETIIYFKNDRNSESVVRMKAKLKEAKE